MFIWRALDKGAVAGLLRLMADRDERAPLRPRTKTAPAATPTKAESEIVPLPVAGKPRYPR